MSKKCLHKPIAVDKNGQSRIIEFNGSSVLKENRYLKLLTKEALKKLEKQNESLAHGVGTFL